MRLLTPPGMSGVAVVWFERAELEAVAACLRTRSGGRFVASGSAAPRLMTLWLDGSPLDEVLVVEGRARAAGADRDRSRPDGIELHLHGSPVVLAALRSHFPDHVAADGSCPGPLAPADRLLRAALSVEQLDLALEQRVADFAGFVAGLAARPAAARSADLQAAIARSAVALAHVEPHRVVLTGARNAGKSTLLNKLLFRERVLTGPLPGLTRDPVRELTTLAGYPYELVDTAGEGELLQGVEQRAVLAGRGLRRGATLLLVVDASCDPSALDRGLAATGQPVLVVANKGDLGASPWPEDFPCHLRLSALRDDPVELRAAVGERLRRHRSLPVAGPVGGPAALSREQHATLTGLGGRGDGSR
ncbi:MAG: 50S ribosome-binding GTPase [Planctomycetes bacterium]|nr:50S ribosome-binding GTPase [Planctomycetota bacterium]